MEDKKIRYTVALVNYEIGGLYLMRDAQRSIGMNVHTGEADNLVPGISYIPLTTELADEYERTGISVEKVNDEIIVKIGDVALKPRVVPVDTE